MSRRIPKGKKVKPVFFFFCEGETELAYIKYLRSTYRLPVEIVPKIAGNSITDRYIADYKKHNTVFDKDIDKTFLIYDCDVEHVLHKLKQLKDVHLLLSNPCFELWFLLHCQNQTAALTSEDCVRKLKTYIPRYSKGAIDEKLKSKMVANKNKSMARAKDLPEFCNPSTDIYRLIGELDAIKNKKTP
jgi:hypothetical protein